MSWLFFAMEACLLRPLSGPHWILTVFYGEQKETPSSIFMA